MKTNWQTKKLGEVCDIFNGGTPDTKNQSYWGSHYFWITPKDMGILTDIYVKETSRKITETGLKNSSAKILPINSVILSSRAPIGYLAINKVPMATNQGCKGLIPKKELNYLFLFYFLFNSVDLLNSLGSGTTFKELSGSKLSEVQILLPSLLEQHRIVKILDEVFEKIKEAKNNTEKNLQNSRDLFEFYLHTIYLSPKVGWDKKSISEIAKIMGGKRVPKGFKLLNDPTNYPYIRVSDFNEYGSINLDEIKYIDERIFEQIKRYTISSKDLYISIAGTIGKTGIVPNQLDGANLTENACKLVFNDGISNKYVYYFTKSRDFLNQAGLNTRTTAMPKLALSRLSIISFSIPKSISEQNTIVKKLDELSEKTKKLEEIYKQKLICLEELKKSILQKAFAGEL